MVYEPPSSSSRSSQPRRALPRLGPFPGCLNLFWQARRRHAVNPAKLQSARGHPGRFWYETSAHTCRSIASLLSVQVASASAFGATCRACSGSLCPNTR